jgi:hypothetical protein
MEMKQMLDDMFQKRLLLLRQEPGKEPPVHGEHRQAVPDRHSERMSSTPLFAMAVEDQMAIERAPLQKTDYGIFKGSDSHGHPSERGPGLFRRKKSREKRPAVMRSDHLSGAAAAPMAILVTLEFFRRERPGPRATTPVSRWQSMLKLPH